MSKSHTQPPQLSSLPSELQRRIFLYVSKPQNLMSTSKAFQVFSKDPSTIVDWLQYRYGKSPIMIEASSSWLRIIDTTTFDIMLRRVHVIPRYVIQRLVHRFQQKNKPELMVRILTRGLDLYDDLSLNFADTNGFRDSYLRNGSLQSFFHLHFAMDPAVEQNMDILEQLVTKYNFNLNYCRWYAF